MVTFQFLSYQSPQSCNFLLEAVTQEFFVMQENNSRPHLHIGLGSYNMTAEPERKQLDRAGISYTHRNTMGMDSS